ncbi:MAG: hypothetical protein AAGK21_05980 [Bacteroidota bacterium]
MAETAPPRWRRRLLTGGYLVAVAAVGLAVLEIAARSLGLGDPILYHATVAGGLRPLPSQSVERVGGARVTIDASGVRSASTTADTAALRVLYLGDSVTWGGSRTDDADTFAEVAADALRQQSGSVYAMNAGVNGTSLLNAADVYRTYADSVDAVVWLFPWGDVTRSYASLGPLWPARLTPRLALVEAVDQVLFRYWLPALRERGGTAEDFEVAEFPPGYAEVGRRELAARQDSNLAAARRVLRDARQRGLPLVLGVTPTLDGAAPAPLAPAARAFLADADTLGAAIFDVHASVDAAGGPDGLFLDAVHLTTEGHRVVGEALGAVLVRQLAAPSSPADS